jgi:tetratricopeptide (TPR) repeat protein
VVHSARLEELRRRLEKDPGSLAFAQLAEELRREGSFREAIQVSRAGLDHHPTYWSARVTLGRALLALDRLDEAHRELSAVLRAAPENLAALRGLAEIHERRGERDAALAHYQAAWSLARHDPDLAAHVARLHDAQAEQVSRAPGHEPNTPTPLDEPGSRRAAGRGASPAEGTGGVAVPLELPAPFTRAWPPPADATGIVEPGGEHAVATVPAGGDARLLAGLESWLRAILADRDHRRPASG